ncbi:MAG: hypothetical protein WC344_04915 [Bacilli bacterium]|jgi:hypothetical protein
MDSKISKFKLPSWLKIALIVLEVALTVFLVTVSIIVMATLGNSTGFIKWLSLPQNVVWFFVLIVLPLIIMFLFNVFLLIKAITAQKEGTIDTTGMTKEQLLEEARRQAREELEAEMKNKVDAPKSE